jgi:hypothetical protein
MGLLIFSPLMDIWPVDAGVKPANIDRSVLLPHPLGPTTATKLPAPILKSMLSSATTSSPSRV